MGAGSRHDVHSFNRTNAGVLRIQVFVRLIQTLNCMEDRSLVGELRELEVALHRSDVRFDQRQLAELLHQHFWEVGRSGAIWSREATMSEFAAHTQPYSVWAHDFKVEAIAPGISLLTYRSAHIGDGGRLCAV